LLKVRFRCEEDYREFQELIGQRMTIKTKSIWHPVLDKKANTLLRYVGDDQMDEFEIDEVL